MTNYPAGAPQQHPTTHPAGAPQQYPAPGAGWAGQPMQPMAPQVRYALWPRRVAAYVLDYFAIWLVPSVLFIFAILTGDPVVRNGEATTDPSPLGIVALLLGLLLGIGLWIWNRLIRQSKTGQSIGKQALKIRLIKAETGRPIDAGTALLREICHAIDNVLYLGWLWPLWDAERQTFADKIVKTYVVRV